MTPDEIQAMAKGLAQGQAVWYVLSACIGGCITGLGAYMAERLKNHATKKDIGAITLKVEEVKDAFNRQMEDLKAHHQLRMVAAERRMQAHQEAYINWLKLLKEGAANDPKQAVIDECQAWYRSNCIFLGVRSRKAFGEAITGMDVLRRFIVVPSDDHSERIASWERMLRAGSVFLEEVNLPPLSAETRQILTDSTAPT